MGVLEATHSSDVIHVDDVCHRSFQQVLGTKSCVRVMQLLGVYLMPLYTGWRPLCLPCATIKFARSSLEAQRRQNGCLGRSKVVHRRFRHRHGRHGRRTFVNMFKTVAQRSSRRLVARRWLKGDRREAQALPWLQNGGTVVDQWSPGNRCCKCSRQSGRGFCLPCASFGRPIVCIER